ncbi:MAG TPA: DUF3105 domain-containing protein [Solirubrobacterales bacterium]|jgi:hypothetical protein|nr:DUF3105 domain-containing protein [Solirubrobacterales bacterium]
MGKGDRDRDRLREERIESEEGESQAGRNRVIVGYAIASTVVLAVAVLVFILASGGDDSGAGGPSDEGGAHINLNTQIGSTNGVQPDDRAGTVPPPVKVTDLKAAAKQAGCELKLKLKDEGHTHIPAGSPEPGYKTSPPTSGNHVEPPYQQADGAYSEMPEAIDFVHSLEHGRMEIQYSPDLSDEGQLALKGVYDTMYGATLLFPNDEMPYEVAATTWTNLIGCKTYKGAITLDAIRDFGKATWGRYGGEPVFAFTFTGPTPVEPKVPKNQ